MTVLCACLATACAAGERRTPEHFSDGTPALHAVQNERLRALMDEMNALLFERMPTELEIDRERRLKAAQIADVADTMARTVDGVVQSLPQLSLDAEEQTVFMVLANRLRQQVATLQAQARGNYIDLIPATMERIGATCDGCHQLFRDPVRRDTPEPRDQP